MGPIGLPLRLPGDLVDPYGSHSEPIWDSVRVQSAAVAAQQTALAEEEIKLLQRRAALENHEEQLAAHLEEKRHKLQELSAQTQAERSALDKDRAAYEQKIDKITGDLTEAQRDILKGQQKIEADRKRLANLQRKLRQRWHRFWMAERQKLQRNQAALAAQKQAVEDQAQSLQERDQELIAKRLNFNTHYELGRCRLREAWQEFHQDQNRWKHRRGKERAALKARESAVKAAENNLEESRRQLLQEKQAWEIEKGTLKIETAGLESRIGNQREKIVALQKEMDRLNNDIWSSQQSDGPEPTSAPNANPSGQEMLPELSATQDAWQTRFHYLEKLAGDLADQRVQLIEQWHRLSLLRHQWDSDRQLTAGELEDLAQRFADNGRQLAHREQAGKQADLVLRGRHEELVQIRQHMIAWRARLRVSEKEWEAERQKLLTEVKSREELADRQLQTLVELRRRWTERRRQELLQLREERRNLELARQENLQQNLLLVDEAAALDNDKRILAEKSMALEQYRQEVLGKADNQATERRLERMRRRWVTHNAEALRSVAQEREALKAALQSLEVRCAGLQTRADLVAQGEAALIENQTAWEHKQTLAASRQTRLEHELHSALAQRNISEQQAARMKEEIERIARSLIDVPDPPLSEALSPAA